MSRQSTLARRAAAEAIGTGLLVATIVGSGIMAARMSGGNSALALLANVFATGLGLVAYILTFGPISGAHFNPVVTLADAAQGGLKWREVQVYIASQIVGGGVGVVLTNIMFDLPAVSISQHERSGFGTLIGELIATFGLMSVIWGCVRSRESTVPFAVAGYVSAAIWFTSSTSFANPAVTIARTLSDTFTGIRPADAPAFIVVEILGAAAATLLFTWLYPSLPQVTDRVVVAHDDDANERPTS